MTTIRAYHRVVCLPATSDFARSGMNSMTKRNVEMTPVVVAAKFKMSLVEG